MKDKYINQVILEGKVIDITSDKNDNTIMYIDNGTDTFRAIINTGFMCSTNDDIRVFGKLTRLNSMVYVSADTAELLKEA